MTWEFNWQKFGIDVGGKRTGQVKLFCPRCRNQRKKNPNDRSLSVNLDSGLWRCHHCEWAGCAANNGGESRKSYIKPDWECKESADDAMFRWFAQRGIPPRVVRRNKIEVRQKKEKSWICFPYFVGESVVNVKFRSYEKEFSFIPQARLTVYGYDDIEQDLPLIFCEGEIDKLSIEAAGVTNCVSVPNGAGTNLDLLGDLEGALQHVKKIIWAGDNDEPGRKLEAEAIRRLGPERCYRVAWPEGCKDANDVLQKHGADELNKCLDNARAVPIEGAFEVNDLIAELQLLYDHGRPRGEHPGWTGLAELYRPRPGDWSVITGSPGSGKTALLAALLVNLAARAGWQFAVFPAENLPPAEYVSNLIEIYTGAPFDDGPSPRATRDEMHEAAGWLDRHFVVMAPEPGKCSLDDILYIARAYVLRRGIRGLVIDPWNQLEHTQMPGQTETQYIAESLIRIRRFARMYGVHIWIVVHPTKLQKENGKYPVATLYDCSGSSAWFNQCDNGLSIWRDKADDSKPVEVHVQKIRHRWVGRLGMTELMFDRKNGRYYETKYSYNGESED